MDSVKGIDTTKDISYRYERPKIPLKRHGVIELGDGYLYRNSKKVRDKIIDSLGNNLRWSGMSAAPDKIRYLKCAMEKEVNCRASYVLEINNENCEKEKYRCLSTHNHPPSELNLQSSRFLTELEHAIQIMPGSTKEIFDQIIEGYPEVKAVYTYSNVVGRMHHWLKKYNIHTRGSRRTNTGPNVSVEIKK